MKPVQVLLLALLVGGAGAAVWFGLGGDTASLVIEEKLFPKLAGNLDSISRLTVSDAKGGKVTIEDKDGIWVVKEKSKYAANVSKVGELILSLADAKQVEQKTANPEFYSRLGLRDISDTESEAILLSLSTPDGDLNVLTGNASDRFGGSTFVRKPDSDTSFLVTPKLTTGTNVDDWIDPGLFDIAADEVQSVKVTNAGVQGAEISKSAMFDSEFDLVGRADDQVLNAVAVRNLAQALAGLNFENVIRDVAFAVNDYKRLNVTYTQFSGIIIDVTLFYRDEPQSGDEETDGPPRKIQYWLNAVARFDESLAQQFVPQPSSSDEATNNEALTLTTADIADLRAEVEHINQTRKRWIYKISPTQFQRMNQSASTLINAN